MANLLQIAKAVKTENRPNHSILLYGPPKSGKTHLAATAAEIPEIKKIVWIDTENGSETLLGMHQKKELSDEALAKIELIKLPDTRANPIAIETCLRMFSTRAGAGVTVCDAHGKVNCIECKTPAGFQGTNFNLADLGHNDLVVLDSGSQLGDSAVNGACKGKPVDYKPGWDEWGLAGKWLGDILSVIQQAHHTNFVVLTHEIMLEGDDGKDKIFPLMGSKAFSMKVAKYFGTVAYVHKKLNKHAAGSSSTYRSDVLTGSRINATLEKSDNPNMREILIEGGILK
jgi:hypothetical protein